jgi:hypothetical protein
MYPSRAQVKARFQQILDDPLGLVFDETVFAPSFGEAFDALLNAFLQYQVPAIEVTAYYTVPAGTTSLTPAQMGIADFGDWVFLAERIAGSTDKYRDLAPVERVPQRAQGVYLGECNFSNSTFYFVGATGNIDLQIRYDASGTAPTSDAALINVDGSLTFLSNYAVSVAGGRKGYDEIAAHCRMAAVGPRYDAGAIGGELFRLVQPRVRSQQKQPLAPRRFSAARPIFARRAVPYATPSTYGTWGFG